MIILERDTYITAHFEAMNCPAEILLDTRDAALAAEQLQAAVQETLRIEGKYSRYREGNIVHEINTSGGKTVHVDEETASLLDYAGQCYDLSGGLFDITTGALRKIWRFAGSEASIQPAELARVRSLIGWDKVRWKPPFLTLPEGFEIDLGGICKEYTADRILTLLRESQFLSTLVNLGGDIAAAGERLWSVGIEDVDQLNQVVQTVHLRQGGIATSGITKRFAKVDGQHLGHILNPLTGWPVKEAPRSVTVASKTCTEAGFWSTLAILHGAMAETFLKDHALEHWCYR